MAMYDHFDNANGQLLTGVTMAGLAIMAIKKQQ